MHFHGPMSILCMLVMSAGIGCAPSLVGPTSPSGYLFSLQVSDHQLWLERTRDSLVYPSVATLVVRVQDSQGRGVDNVPVSFNVSDNGTQDKLLTPMQATTQGGLATTLFQPTTICVYYVTAQVEQRTQQAVIYVNRRDLCCSCQVWPVGHDCARGL
jgi:hypothetical protein